MPGTPALKLTGEQLQQLLRLRRQLGGSLAYHCHARGLPTGPSCIGQVAQWPRLMVRDFFHGWAGNLRARRLCSLLEDGLVVHTECSGKMTPEATSLMMDVALRQNGMVLPRDWLVNFAACDSSLMCQKVISSAKHAPIHLFKGMLEKLPTKHQEAIKARRPAAEASKEDRVAAYRSMDKYLRDHANEIYPPGSRTASCCIHPGQSCAVRWADPSHAPPGRRPLTISISGPPCRPFTMYNNLQTFSHEDMEAWYLWINGVKHQDFDMLVLENSEHFLKDLLVDGMPKQYDIKHAIFGSQDQGWPVRRRRFYGFCLNRHELVWVGPEGVDVLPDFLAWFGRACALEADDFIGLDGDASYMEVLLAMAHKRGIYPTAEQIGNLHKDWPSLLPRSQHHVYTAAKEVHQEGSRTGLAGSFAVDLSQSVSRMRSGPWVPTVARSTLMCSMSRGRLMTGREVDACMGWPAIRLPGNNVYADAVGMDDMFSEASPHARRQLAGNGMMLPQVMAWLLYVYSHTVRKDRLQQLPMRLRSAAVPSADSEDDTL